MADKGQWALWNGALMPLSDVRVSPLDRAYLFGDAAYEVLRVYEGVPFLLEAHVQRLRASLDGLMIPFDAARFRDRLSSLLAAARPEEAAIYVQISRGEAPRTHLPPPGMQPNELIWVDPLPKNFGAAKREAGVRVRLHPDWRWGLCRIKSVNLLGNILAGMAAREAGDDEALLYDRDGRITEGMHSTFFGVAGNTLITTPLSANILPGITRSLVIDLANSLDLPVVERSLARAELQDLDELFFTGTLSEVQPIVEVDGIPVKNGKPGPVTRRLFSVFMAWASAAIKQSGDRRS